MIVRIIRILGRPEGVGHEGLPDNAVGQSRQLSDADLDFLHSHEGGGFEVAAEELRAGLGFEHGDHLDVEALDGLDPEQSTVEGLVALSADDEGAHGVLVWVPDDSGPSCPGGRRPSTAPTRRSALAANGPSLPSKPGESWSSCAAARAEPPQSCRPSSSCTTSSHRVTKDETAHWMPARLRSMCRRGRRCPAGPWRAGLRVRSPGIDRVRTPSVSRASAGSTATMIPIGKASVAPPAPASGASAPPIMNWLKPSSAAADPACPPWSARAWAAAFGMTRPTLETRTNRPIRSAGRGARVSTAARTVVPPAVAPSRPASSSTRARPGPPAGR